MKDWSLLHAYVDGQLKCEELAEVEAWIASDPAAQRELQSIHALKGSIREHCRAVDCPETWAKCKSRLTAFDRKRGIEKLVGKYAWGMCSIFIVAIVSAAMLNRSTATLNTSDVMSANLTPFSSPTSQAQGERERWLRGLFGRDLPVRTDVIQVLGGQRGKLHGQDVIKLDLADSHGAMVLYLAPDAGKFSDVSEAASTYGVIRTGDSSGLTWSDRGVACLLLGNRSLEQLQAAAQEIRRD